MPHEAVAFFVFNFQVAHRRFQHRVPVHQALATINQALLIQTHKGFGHGFGQFGVHREVFAAPIHTRTHAAHLGGDGVAALLFPLPDFGDEVFARLKRCVAHAMTADALGLKLALDNHLGRNARMVCSRNPGRVEASHAVVTGQRVHDGLVEGMAHVQSTRHIRRGQLNGKRGGIGFCLLRPSETSVSIVPLLPLWPPLRFNGCRFERF